MRIHREGNRIILVSFLLLALVNVAVSWFCWQWIWLPSTIMIASLVLFILIVRFFRVPDRSVELLEDVVYTPADGKVVAIEKVFEGEYLKEERIQLSVFMSPLNVHIQWYPINGKVKYSKYHEGKYLVAFHPKSSTENERTSIVVEDKKGRSILFRQIAGAVARRIVCYAKERDQITQADEAGFIKFGSRVDLMLPLDADIKVNIGDKVVGSQTILAKLK